MCAGKIDKVKKRKEKADGKVQIPKINDSKCSSVTFDKSFQFSFSHFPKIIVNLIHILVI